MQQHLVRPNHNPDKGIIMANKQLLLPGEIVKKRNELIRCRISIASQSASRILACLIACIKTTDTDLKDTYKIPIKNFLTDDGGGKPYTRIRETCRELAKATYEQEYTDIDEFITVPFFTSIAYKKGVVEATFNPLLQMSLTQLQRCFTEYDLMEYLNLPSLYSQRIFEILKSYSSLPDVTITLDELHKMLNTPVSFQTDFRQLRTRVLERAYKDIKKFTNLEYEWEPLSVDGKPLKRGRAVYSVRFVFSKGKIEEQKKEQAEADKKKISAANNKLALDVIACRKVKGLKSGEKCAKPDCSKRQQTVCVEIFM